MAVQREVKPRLELSSFSVLLIFLCLGVLGLFTTQYLIIQLKPQDGDSQLNITFSWQNTSPRIIEHEVTSKLEAALNTIKGVSKISSISNEGWGVIDIKFKKGINMDAARFEVSNLIRVVFNNLPDGVTYPQIFNGAASMRPEILMTYSLNSHLSQIKIQNYANGVIVPELKGIEGIGAVEVLGFVNYKWEITFDINKTEKLKIRGEDIKNSIVNYYSINYLDNSQDLISLGGLKNNSIILQCNNDKGTNWGSIPIKSINNRIIFLRDIAIVKYLEEHPKSYFRNNGLNSINILIYPKKTSNVLNLSKAVEDKISEIETTINSDFNLSLSYDSSVYLKNELNKIFNRIGFSIVLIFVAIWIFGDGWKHVIVIGISLILNLLISCIFYYLFKIEIHFFSLAGLVIVFGMVMSNYVIMTKHFDLKRNKLVFRGIIGSSLTSIAAICIILLLDEGQRVNLIELIYIVTINLLVSVLLSYYFVPALITKLPTIIRTNNRVALSRFKLERIIILYSYLIAFLRKFKWGILCFIVFSFGLPLHVLPDKLEGDDLGVKLFNNTIGSSWFVEKARPNIELLFGGSLGLFEQSISNTVSDSEPSQTALFIYARMPDGSTLEQMNNVIVKMESEIGKHSQVRLYQSSIFNSRSSRISVFFDEESVDESFPYKLKSLLESKATEIGGCTWSIIGLGQGFNNSTEEGPKNQQIVLNGYNYDQLYDFAIKMREHLVNNPRIKNVSISSSLDEFQDDKIMFSLSSSSDELRLINSNKSSLYKGILSNQFSSLSNLNSLEGDFSKAVLIESSAFLNFDPWLLNNLPIQVGNDIWKISSVASLKKRNSEKSIVRHDQQYQLMLSFDFIGSYILAENVMDLNVRYFKELLPVGYSIKPSYWELWDKNESGQYLIIFAGLFVIFLISSVVFESVLKALVIIGLVPISFIGIFLTFYFYGITFDQGGYVAMIIVCGISVNAGIHVMNDFNQLSHIKDPIERYILSLKQRIGSVLISMLTIILSMLPIIVSGSNEPFWYALAFGTMGGVIFSLFGLVFFLPAFLPMKMRTSNSLTS